MDRLFPAFLGDTFEAAVKGQTQSWESLLLAPCFLRMLWRKFSLNRTADYAGEGGLQGLSLEEEGRGRALQLQKGSFKYERGRL